MTKATIDDLVNIAAGYGVITDTPSDRAMYRARLRDEGARVAAAAANSPRGAKWLRRKHSAGTPAAASTGQPSAAPVAPAQPPTEYPQAWVKGRSLGRASAVRGSGVKPVRSRKSPADARRAPRITEGNEG